MRWDGRVTAVDVARALPDIETLRDRCRAFARLEAIVSPQEESRYYCYDRDWGPGAEAASMQNGSGDFWHIVFKPAGAIVLGFAHESLRLCWRVRRSPVICAGG